MTVVVTLAAAALLNWVGPNPAMAPREVIAAVVDALQHNNSPRPNAGVMAVYQFASPANRRVTGPYGRFFLSVRSPPYAPLLRPSTVEFDAMRQDGERASQNVTVRGGKGEMSTFHFEVSRQHDGPCIGCWMVDTVVPVR